jgi:hypothetical protein
VLLARLVVLFSSCSCSCRQTQLQLQLQPQLALLCKHNKQHLAHGSACWVTQPESANPTRCCLTLCLTLCLFTRLVASWLALQQHTLIVVVVVGSAYNYNYNTLIVVLGRCVNNKSECSPWLSLAHCLGRANHQQRQ